MRPVVALGLGCLFYLAVARWGEGNNQKLGGEAPMLNPSEVKNVEMGSTTHPKPPGK